MGGTAKSVSPASCYQKQILQFTGLLSSVLEKQKSPASDWPQTDPEPHQGLETFLSFPVGFFWRKVCIVSYCASTIFHSNGGSLSYLFHHEIYSQRSLILSKTYVLLKLHSSKPSYIKFPFSLACPRSVSLLLISRGKTFLNACGQAMGSVVGATLMAFLWQRKRTGIPSTKHFPPMKSVYYFFW